jgi:ABC-type uncharacterized transport system involved in gliding motility auxiliary subunit
MQVTSIIQSSAGTLGDQPSSWLETDLTSQSVKYDEGKDIQGPVSMAVSIAPADQAASSAPTSTTTVKTKLVVYGDADFASNFWLQQDPSNLDLFANSVSWLAGANELVSIRAKAPDAPRTITLSTGQQSVLFFSTIVGMPLLVMLMGAFIWWRRR